MRLRSPMFAFGVAALLMVDLAGCDSNPGGPTAPAVPAASGAPSAPATGNVPKATPKVPGQKAAGSQVTGTE
jgi:hypothetical protein